MGGCTEIEFAVQCWSPMVRRQEKRDITRPVKLPRLEAAAEQSWLWRQRYHEEALIGLWRKAFRFTPRPVSGARAIIGYPPARCPSCRDGEPPDLTETRVNRTSEA